MGVVSVGCVEDGIDDLECVKMYCENFGKICQKMQNITNTR